MKKYIWLLFLPALTSAADVIVDNKGSTWSNVPGWSSLSLSSAYKGETLKTVNKGAWSTYRFGGLASGKYDVYMYWPVWTGALPDSAAPVVIKHATGTQTITVNQQQNGGKWNPLGSWTLDSTAYLTITGQGNGPIYSDAVKLVPSPGTPQFVVGLNVQQHTGGFDAAGQAFTKELEADSIRVGYKHGDHNFGVNWAAQNGVGVLFFLGYGSGCNVTTASGRQCYADRSAALAKTYGGKVQYYEVWNEWNGGLGLGCKWNEPDTPCVDAAMYTDLLCRTYKAVKAVRPEAVIVGGATAGVDTSFISKMLGAGAGSCMDMVSVHPYVHTKTKYAVPYDSPASVGVDKFIEAITAVKNLVQQKTGKTIPIVVSEEGRSDRGIPAQEQVTADYIRELYARAPSVPFLEGIWWFCLEDPNPTVDPSAVGYGVVRSNNTKKPAFGAFKAAATE